MRKEKNKNLLLLSGFWLLFLTVCESAYAEILQNKSNSVEPEHSNDILKAVKQGGIYNRYPEKNDKAASQEADIPENTQDPVPLILPDLPLDQNLAVLRDPFNLAAGLGGTQNAGSFANQSRFLPNPGNVSIPQIILRGIVHPDAGKKDYLALLEIGNHGVFMVREGDEISFDQTRPSAAIKVKKISRLSVIVEAGSLGNTLIIR